jgi:hypothetical protein
VFCSGTHIFYNCYRSGHQAKLFRCVATQPSAESGNERDSGKACKGKKECELGKRLRSITCALPNPSNTCAVAQREEGERGQHQQQEVDRQSKKQFKVSAGKQGRGRGRPRKSQAQAQAKQGRGRGRPKMLRTNQEEAEKEEGEEEKDRAKAICSKTICKQVAQPLCHAAQPVCHLKARSVRHLQGQTTARENGEQNLRPERSERGSGEEGDHGKAKCRSKSRSKCQHPCARTSANILRTFPPGAQPCLPSLRSAECGGEHAEPVECVARQEPSKESQHCEETQEAATQHCRGREAGACGAVGAGASASRATPAAADATARAGGADSSSAPRGGAAPYSLTACVSLHGAVVKAGGVGWMAQEAEEGGLYAGRELVALYEAAKRGEGGSGSGGVGLYQPRADLDHARAPVALSEPPHTANAQQHESHNSEQAMYCALSSGTCAVADAMAGRGVALASLPLYSTPAPLLPPPPPPPLPPLPSHVLCPSEAADRLETEAEACRSSGDELEAEAHGDDFKVEAARSNTITLEPHPNTITEAAGVAWKRHERHEGNEPAGPPPSNTIIRHTHMEACNTSRQDTHLHATIIGKLKDGEEEEAASEEEAAAEHQGGGEEKAGEGLEEPTSSLKPRKKKKRRTKPLFTKRRKLDMRGAYIAGVNDEHACGEGGGRASRVVNVDGVGCEEEVGDGAPWMLCHNATLNCTYTAKIVGYGAHGMVLVHYRGWNESKREWVPRDRLTPIPSHHTAPLPGAKGTSYWSGPSDGPKKKGRDKTKQEEEEEEAVELEDVLSQVCYECAEPGNMLSCSKCRRQMHAECVGEGYRGSLTLKPPTERKHLELGKAESEWTCRLCVKTEPVAVAEARSSELTSAVAESRSSRSSRVASSRAHLSSSSRSSRSGAYAAHACQGGIERLQYLCDRFAVNHAFACFGREVVRIYELSALLEASGMPAHDVRAYFDHDVRGYLDQKQPPGMPPPPPQLVNKHVNILHAPSGSATAKMWPKVKCGSTSPKVKCASNCASNCASLLQELTSAALKAGISLRSKITDGALEETVVGARAIRQHPAAPDLLHCDVCGYNKVFSLSLTS